MALDECGDGSEHHTRGLVAKGRQVEVYDDDARRPHPARGFFVLGQELPTAETLILIVGPDQTEADWQECLVRAGLSDAEGNLDDAVDGVFHKGCPLHQDEDGIDQILEYCR